MNWKNTLLISRIDYTETTTIGLFSVNGQFWGYSLEDARRLEKIPGATCIWPGEYKVIVTRSNRFKRFMPLLVNVDQFEGVRIHGGNDHTNTDGCPLIASNRPSRDRIQGSLEKKLMDYLRSQIVPMKGEKEEDFWKRLPPTRIIIQDRLNWDK